MKLKQTDYSEWSRDQLLSMVYAMEEDQKSMVYAMEEELSLQKSMVYAMEEELRLQNWQTFKLVLLFLVGGLILGYTFHDIFGGLK